MAPVDVVLSYLAAFTTAEPAAIAAHVSDDFWNEHVAALGSSSNGRAEYLRRLPGFLADFVDLRYEVEDTVSEADKVVVAYRMTACYQGTDIAVRGVFRFRVEAELIKHRTDYFDSKSFLDQLDGSDG